MLNIKFDQNIKQQTHQNHQISKSYVDAQSLLDDKKIHLRLPVINYSKSAKKNETPTEIVRPAFSPQRKKVTNYKYDQKIQANHYLNFSSEHLPLISNTQVNQQNSDIFMNTSQDRTVIIKIPIKFTIQYKEKQFYFCKGNNHQLIEKLLKQRNRDWVEAPNSNNFVHFTWTQYGQNHDFKKHCQLDSFSQRQTFNQFEFHKELTTKIGLFKNLTRYFRDDLQKVFNITPVSFVISLKRTSGKSDIQNFLAFYLKNQPEQFKQQQHKQSIELKYLKRFQQKNQVSVSEKNLDYTLVQISNNFTSKDSYIWILKANDWNRGDGIHVWERLSRLETLLNQYYYGHQENKLAILNKSGSDGEEKKTRSSSLSPTNNWACKHFIIQKYLEKPFLINKRKFDIRIWVLLTHQMEYFVCKEGYIRTSSEIFELNTENPFIHLTNNAVQKYSENYGARESGNQLSYNDFDDYLKKINIKLGLKNDILPQINLIINIAMQSVASLINRNKSFYCYQVFGFDFILDKNLQPWLIEVNTNPCLEESSNLLQQLIPRMVNDAFKLTIDLILHLHSKQVFSFSPYKDDENIWEKLGSY